jgi:cell division protein ZipA
VYQSKQNEAQERLEPALADECTVIDGMPVVARADRRHLPKVSVEPALTTPAAQQFAANEELETGKFFVEPQAATNVVALAPAKAEKTEPAFTFADDDAVQFDDDFIDTVAMSASQSKVVEAQDYIVVYITAGRVPFDGERLLKSVSNFGLRFGEMGMFHRHEHPNGHGQVLFSMARVDDVGAFDLEAMGSEFISAVTLFLALPNQQPYLAYDMMIDTAKRLAHEFCGQVLDQNQNPLNRQLIEHYREQVVEFTRHNLMSKAV